MLTGYICLRDKTQILFMWSCFHTKLLKLIDKYIPIKTFDSKPKPKWLDCSTLKRLRSNIKLGIFIRPPDVMKTSFLILSVETLLLQLLNMPNKQTFEMKLAKDIQQNPTLFWKYV